LKLAADRRERLADERERAVDERERLLDLRESTPELVGAGAARKTRTKRRPG
jgi:hypothetical protein